MLQEEPMSEVQMTPDQIVDAMPEYLLPEKAGTTKATIQFDLSGADSGKWWVKIHDGKAESGKGEPGELPHLIGWVAAPAGRLACAHAARVPAPPRSYVEMIMNP